MKKLFVANKETGTKIEEVSNILEGLSLIDKFENDDRAEGIYAKDFYDIVDDDCCTVDVSDYL